MDFHTTGSGTYPVPFTWESTCTGAGGSGLFTGDWQSQVFGPTSSACATLIELGGGGSGTVSVLYY